MILRRARQQGHSSLSILNTRSMSSGGMGAPRDANEIAPDRDDPSRLDVVRVHGQDFRHQRDPARRGHVREADNPSAVHEVPAGADFKR